MKNSTTFNPRWSRFLPDCKGILTVLFCLLVVVPSFAQNRVIKGRVSSADDNSALPGVNILVKGTTTGTVSDGDGNYSIEVPDNAVLVFSFVGYKTSEQPLGGQNVINVSMETEYNALSEVVVIGYGTVKKADLTGSVSVIEPKELLKVSTNDVTQMMQGRVPGVSVTSDGQPGASPTVKIRGISTFGTSGTSSEPLYVVDGLPLGTTIVTTGDNFQPNAAISAIRDINPNDIESIQVLKDASAGAIYGVRAANGVVIITTKKGKFNAPLKVDVNMYTGIQNVPFHIPVLHTADFQMINRETFTNAGRLDLLPAGNDPNSPQFIKGIDTDWQKAGFKQGSISNVNVGLSGGSASTTYYGSVDMFRNNGTFVGNGPSYNRYSARLNMDTKKGNLRFGEKIYVMRSEETSQLRVSGTPGANPPFVNDLVWDIPTLPITDPTRVGGYSGSSAVQDALVLNVIGLNHLVSSHRNISRAIFQSYAEYDIFKSLTYRINGAYDFTQQNDDTFIPVYDLGFFYPNGSATYAKSLSTRTSGLIENTLSFKKTFGKHNVDAVAGETFQNFKSDFVNAQTSGLPQPYIPTLSNGTGTKSVAEQLGNYSLFSLLGRVNYNYDDRYFVTANIRRDGSSKFISSNRYAVMPSVAVAWKINRDLHLPSFVNELKLRGGYGRVGNQNIPLYGSQATLDPNITYAFNGNRVFGTAATGVIDPNLKWELRTTRSIGIDATLFDDLDVTVEYYSNKAENLLVGVPIPGSAGATANGNFLVTNGGTMQNTGMEISFNYRKHIGDWSIEIAPNMYTLKNRVLSLHEGLGLIEAQNERTQVGGPMARHYGYVYDGLFQTQAQINSSPTQQPGTGPGDIKFKDLNGDGVIDASDRTFLKSSIPDIYYGLNISVKYKAFDFTIFGSGNSGAYAVNNMYQALMSSQSSGNQNYHKDILKRWTPENTNTNIPRMIALDPNFNAQPSNRPGWLQSTAYLRINTVSLGYTLPANVLDNLHMSRLRVYATCQNLWTFTSYKGFNPDFQGISPVAPGYDFGTYPRPRTIMVGLQASF